MKQKELLWNELKQNLQSKHIDHSKTKQQQHHISNSSQKCPHLKSLQEKRNWPSYNSIMQDVLRTDYNHVLECPFDKLTKSNTEGKTFCPYGTVCCAKIEIFPSKNKTDDNKKQQNPNYTGLFQPGQTNDNCILRLSSAVKPPITEKTKVTDVFVKAMGGKLKHAKIFPMAALKCFRQNQRSGNLLFSGPKIGQDTYHFFHRSLCTQVTERVPITLKPFIQTFYRYSKNPLALGISDFCSYDINGEMSYDANGNTQIHFPYVVILHPVYNYDKPKQQQTKDLGSGSGSGAGAKNDDIHKTQSSTSSSSSEEETFDSFLSDLLKIPCGSVLFDIYACPTPKCALNPNEIERIGQIKSTTEMILSHPNDGLFFRHQKKEEDYELHPEWKKEIKLKCSPDDGKTIGTIDRLVGSTILQQLIEKKQYIDFETN